MNESIKVYVDGSFRTVRFVNATLYFSYNTLIAYKLLDKPLRIRKNDWGPTTGGHLNTVSKDKSIRMQSDNFIKLYKKELNFGE